MYGIQEVVQAIALAEQFVHIHPMSRVRHRNTVKYANRLLVRANGYGLEVAWYWDRQMSGFTDVVYVTLVGLRTPTNMGFQVLPMGSW